VQALVPYVAAHRLQAADEKSGRNIEALVRPLLEVPIP
jgi:hypothetical protein